MTPGRTLKDVKANHTTVVLTEENIQNTDAIAGYDLGFIVAVCEHCGAHLYLGDSGVVTCLNTCYLSAGAARKLTLGLLEAQARLQANEEWPK